ncbi:MAG: NUDIX domain-containing protein [Myxococcota bacterium]
MTERVGEHRGVGLLVTDAARQRFYVQQKDASYPNFPRAYSFFGGACEAGETVEAALARELREELGPKTADMLLEREPVALGSYVVTPAAFRFTLFETVVDHTTLERLAAAPVFEGERGAVVTRGELAALPFVWGLERVVAAYLRRLP